MKFVGCFLYIAKKTETLLTLIAILRYQMISLPFVTLLTFTAAAATAVNRMCAHICDLMSSL